MALPVRSLLALTILALAFGCGTSTSRGGESAARKSAAGAQGSDPAEGPVTARLIADVSHVASGQEFTLAVELEVDDGWYIHWIHPGEGGAPTKVAPSTPEGFEAGEPRYPGPDRFDLSGGEIRYGYAEGVLVSFPVVAPDELAPSVELSAEAEWLACRGTDCQPGRAEPRLELAAATPKAPSRPAHADRFADHLRRLPAELSDVEGARTSWNHAGDGRAELAIEIPGAGELAFFPEGEIGLVGQAVTPSEGGKALRLWLDSGTGGRARGVIRMTRGGETRYLRVSLDVPDGPDLGAARGGDAR